MFLALTSMDSDTTYNIPLTDFTWCTNIPFGELTLVEVDRLLGQAYQMIELNQTYDDLGNLTSGILYRKVPTLEMAQALFNSGELFMNPLDHNYPSSEQKKSDSKEREKEEKTDEVIPPENREEQLPNASDELTLVEGGEKDPEESDPEVQVKVNSELKESEETSGGAPEEGSDAKQKLTLEQLEALDMNSLREHGRLWNQKSRSRSDLIKEILAAQSAPKEQP